MIDKIDCVSYLFGHESIKQIKPKSQKQIEISMRKYNGRYNLFEVIF